MSVSVSVSVSVSASVSVFIHTLHPPSLFYQQIENKTKRSSTLLYSIIVSNVVPGKWKNVLVVVLYTLSRHPVMAPLGQAD